MKAKSRYQDKSRFDPYGVLNEADISTDSGELTLSIWHLMSDENKDVGYAST